MQQTTQASALAAYPGPDRRERERRAAASATEFARGQKFGRHEADAEIARLKLERDAAVEALSTFCVALRAGHDVAETMAAIRHADNGARAVLASIVGLCEGNRPITSTDVDQRVPVIAARAQEIDPVAVDLGLDRSEHNSKSATSAGPHPDAPVVDGERTAVRAALASIKQGGAA